MTFIKKYKLLLAIFILYVVLFIFAKENAIASLKNTAYYLKELAFVMPVVIIFTVLINAWLPQKTITKHLGNQSGFKGNLLALFVGMFSTGPIYAAFPIASVLYKKGTSTMNITIILSAWAVIKVPMLFNEVKFLGFEFMIVRWILTVIAIFIMGIIMQYALRSQTEQ